jgi:hypothetical protein
MPLALIPTTNVDAISKSPKAARPQVKQAFEQINDLRTRLIFPASFGAVGDGVADDTAAIQEAIDYAAGFYNQVAYPPAGGVFNAPIVVFTPGSYRLTAGLKTYSGVTLMALALPAYTVNHTRLILDTVGGTTNLNTHILQLTRNFQGTVRVGSYTGTIDGLEFWIMNPGSTMAARGGAAFTASSTTGLGNQGTGCHIYCNEPCIDVRIVRTSHYTTPNAAIWFNQASTAAASDVEIDTCEFDTCTAGVRFTSGALMARMTGNQAYNTGYFIHAADSVGSLKISGGISQYQARIKVTSTVGMDQVHLGDHMSDGAGGLGNFFEGRNIRRLSIHGNVLGTSSGSTILAYDVDGGVITSNVINNAGYNASVSAPSTDAAAIRAMGCQGMVIAQNSILTGDTTGTYSGFGIATEPNGARASRCDVAGNFVSEKYNGAGYRSQSRRVNLTDTDTRSSPNRFGPGVNPDYWTLVTDTMVQYTVPSTYMASAGTFDVPLSLVSACRVWVMASQLSSADNMEFMVSVGKATFSGAYLIKNVDKNGVSGSGNGPHAVTTGNTVSFSIVTVSGAAYLRITFAYASDPMNFAVQMDGLK